MNVEIIYDDDTHLFLQSVFIIAIGLIKITINLEKNSKVDRIFKHWRRRKKISLIQEGCNSIKTIQKCRFLTVHKIYMKDSIYILLDPVENPIVYQHSQHLINNI